MKGKALAAPPIVPGISAAERVKWWQSWTKYLQDSAGQFDIIDGERFYWGEHLFIGYETHKELHRIARAIGVRAEMYTDALEYDEVTDVRTWRETNPAVLVVHRDILKEHVYFAGPTGGGKTSLGLIPLLIQSIGGSRTMSNELSPPEPKIIFDFKGDPVLFNTARIEADRRGQVFRFFTIEKDKPTYRFNPFRGFDRSQRSVAQLCQLMLDALSLNHGKGYGRSYYTERSRHLLSLTLKRHSTISSFDELHLALRSTVSSLRDTRAKTDAFELLSVIETLTEYKQLVTGPDEDLSNTDNVIFLPRVIENREIVYFWLPAALESIAVGEIGKLGVFNLRVAAQDWLRNHPDEPRNITLVIDEAQHMVGENLLGVLQDARSFGISAILANQSLRDLRTASGFDLAPTVMTNTRLKFFFTTASERECYGYVERGKGFTKARQFPQRGNPWLRELAPEEFAYHIRLSWPFSYEEYKRRKEMPWPRWDDIPGGNCWVETKSTVNIPVDIEERSAILPHEFSLIHDPEWARQLQAIRMLFSAADRTRDNQDDVIENLLFDEDRSDTELGEEDEEQ